MSFSLVVTNSLHYNMLKFTCVILGFEMQLRMDIGGLAKDYGLCINGYNKP